MTRRRLRTPRMSRSRRLCKERANGTSWGNSTRFGSKASSIVSKHRASANAAERLGGWNDLRV